MEKSLGSTSGRVGGRGEALENGEKKGTRKKVNHEHGTGLIN